MVKQRQKKIKTDLQVQMHQKKTENEFDRHERLSASYSNFGPGETEQDVIEKRLDSQKGTKEGLDDQLSQQKAAYNVMRTTRREQEKRQQQDYQNAYHKIELEMQKKKKLDQQTLHKSLEEQAQRAQIMKELQMVNSKVN